MKRRIFKYAHDEADDAIFHRSKNGEVRLFAFMRRGYLPSFSVRHAGRQSTRRNGCDMYVLLAHTPYHVS